MLAVPVSLVGTFALFPHSASPSHTVNVGLVWLSGWWSTTRLWLSKACSAISRRDWLRRTRIEGDEELSGPVVGLRWCWLRCSSLRRSFRASPETLSTIRHDHRHFRDALAFNAPLSAQRSRVCCCGQNQRRNLQAPRTSREFFDVFNRYWTADEWFVRWSLAVFTKARSCWCCGRLWPGRVFLWQQAALQLYADEDQGYIYVSMQLPSRRRWNAQARLRNR